MASGAMASAATAEAAGVMAARVMVGAAASCCTCPVLRGGSGLLLLASWLKTVLALRPRRWHGRRRWRARVRLEEAQRRQQQRQLLLLLHDHAMRGGTAGGRRPAAEGGGRRRARARRRVLSAGAMDGQSAMAGAAAVMAGEIVLT